MHRHALSDAQWKRIEPLLPRRPQGRKSTLGDRLFIDAVLFRAKTGMPWRDLPERFGPWKSVYNRFANWAAKDHWALFKSAAHDGQFKLASKTVSFFTSVPPSGLIVQGARDRRIDARQEGTASGSRYVL